MDTKTILPYGFTVCALVLVLISFFSLPQQVPLWYSLAIPEQQLVPKFFLLLFPGFMFTICVMHSLIINRFKQLDATIIKIFSFGTTLVTFLFLVGLIHILYILL